MDSLDKYRQIVRDALTEYTKIPYSYGHVHDETVFDCEADRYLLVVVGWDRHRRVYGCLIHIDIIDGKLWIQQDGTEAGIATELERAGIPKERIVLAFQPADVRPHTGYAVA